MGVARGNRGGDGEHGASEGAALDLIGDVLEDVALGQDIGTGADLEAVAAGCVVVPVVVDSVEESVALDLRGAAGHVVDVVVLEGHHVVGTIKVHSPIMMVVSRGRPGGVTVEVAVGDSHTARGLSS